MGDDYLGCFLRDFGFVDIEENKLTQKSLFSKLVRKNGIGRLFGKIEKCEKVERLFSIVFDRH